MSVPTRPDLSQVSPEVRAYIEHLEAQLARRSRASSPRAEEVSELAERPTTAQVIVISRQGLVKRTPRHLYHRQRRGGLGAFDLECSPPDEPAHILVADRDQRLFLLSDRQRAFVLAVADLPERPARSARGTPLADLIPLQDGESVAVALPLEEATYLYLLSREGWVRRVAGHQVPRLAPGALLEIRPGHRPVAGCWGDGQGDLFVATAGGLAVRFQERKVPIQGGCLALRLAGTDRACGIAAVQETDMVLLMAADGRGTLRRMTGFRAHKSPGAQGKAAMKTQHLVGVQRAQPGQDVFVLSGLSKGIRFSVDEIPPKEGTVQGVQCMALRNDRVVAFTLSQAGEPPDQEAQEAALP